MQGNLSQSRPAPLIPPSTVLAILVFYLSQPSQTMSSHHCHLKAHALLMHIHPAAAINLDDLQMQEKDDTVLVTDDTVFIQVIKY